MEERLEIERAHVSDLDKDAGLPLLALSWVLIWPATVVLLWAGGLFFMGRVRLEDYVLSLAARVDIYGLSAPALVFRSILIGSGVALAVSVVLFAMNAFDHWSHGRKVRHLEQTIARLWREQ